MDTTSVGSAKAAERFQLDNPDDFTDLVFEQGWTDGFPVFMPTPSKVEEVVRYLGRPPEEVLGTVSPGEGIATVEKVAVNCVMAGCKPEYAPVVLAIVDALLDPRFHLLNAQASTIGGPPMVIVSGPVVKKLDFNYAEGTYGGSGHRANGTVARAIRLILWNIGEGKPGRMAKAVFGTPYRWGSLIVERPRGDGNPWEELHVTAGLSPEDSAITVLDGRGGYVHTPFVRTGAPVEASLPWIARQLMLPDIGLGGGGTCIFAVNPDMAKMLAEKGWSKERFRDALYEHCYVSVAEMREMTEAMGGMDDAANTTVKDHWTSRVADLGDPSARVYSLVDREHLVMLVSGGSGGGHTCYQWRGGRHSSDGYGLVTKRIDWKW